MIRLKSHLKAPPGNFVYEQTTGIHRKFEATPLIEQLAYAVADFRKGNNLPGSDYASALGDIDFFNCQRLGFSKRWCYDSDVSPQVAFAKKGSGCSTCGRPVN